MKINPTPFIFLRHGQTDWNAQGRLQGSSDIELNDTGIMQAKEASLLLAGENIGSICCSPLKRARKTAEIVAENQKCSILEINELAECDFGNSEGTTGNDWLHAWLAGDVSLVPDDVEAFEHFTLRIIQGINRALAQSGPVLIVAHGGTYTPVNQLLHRDERWSLPNCLPVRHLPPEDDESHWKKSIITKL